MSLLRRSHSLLTLFGSASPLVPFSPTQIAGLMLWLEADTLALSDTDPVTTWADSSGLGNDATQAVAGAKPTFRTSVINGLPVVRFDQTDDLLATASFSLVHPFTIFVVTKFNQAQSGNDTLFDGVTAVNSARLYRASATQLQMYAGGGGPTPTTTPEAFHVLTCIYNGASSGMRVDGGAAVTGDPSNTNPGGITLNATAPLGNPGGQDMAAFLTYQGVVSAPNQLLAESYLKTKYATP